MTKKKDLKGQRFGKLTVMEPAENQGGYTSWLCQCDCGNKKIVQTRNLLSGATKSCGCLAKETCFQKKDITGQRFGKLTALYPTEKRKYGGSVVWACKCDCGNLTEVDLDGLMKGNILSCGCMREENSKKLPQRLNKIDGTCVEWLAKRKHRSDNTSGFRGVWEVNKGVYRAAIGFKRKKYYLGFFTSYDKAVQSRLYAEEIIHTGFVKAREQWERECRNDPEYEIVHPFAFDVRKEPGRLVISSSDPEYEGKIIETGHTTASGRFSQQSVRTVCDTVPSVSMALYSGEGVK